MQAVEQEEEDGCRNIITEGRAVVECRDSCQHHACNKAGTLGDLSLLLLALLILGQGLETETV